MGVGSDTYPYALDYGVGCGVHEEYGSTSCYTPNAITEADHGPKLADQETWCNSEWCYVDECKCEDSAAAPSVYFSYQDDAGQTKNPYYSYATCDGVDTFSEAYNAN